MQMGCFRWKMNKTGDDEGISWLDKVSGSSVDVNLSVSIAAIENIGLKAGTASNVPHMHGFVGKEAGALQEGAGNGDTTLVVEVGLRNDGPVNLGEK